MTGLLELTASALQVCRLQVVEKAMRWLLIPGREPVEIRSARKALGRVQPDVTVMSGSAAPFVRYFSSVTPPLPSGMEVPRALVRKQFSVMLDQIAKRLGTDRRLTAVGQADQGRAATTFDN
jgi:hypothetical protein